MDKTVRLWHVSRNECLCCFQHLDFVTAIAFHPKVVEYIALFSVNDYHWLTRLYAAIQQDDRFFLSGSLDCKLRLWNISEKKVAFWNELPDPNLITAVGFTGDGKMCAAGSYLGLCLFYETEGLRYNTQINVRSSRGRNAKGRKITGIESMPCCKLGEEKVRCHNACRFDSNQDTNSTYSTVSY